MFLDLFFCRFPALQDMCHPLLYVSKQNLSTPYVGGPLRRTTRTPPYTLPLWPDSGPYRVTHCPLRGQNPKYEGGCARYVPSILSGVRWTGT